MSEKLERQISAPSMSFREDSLVKISASPVLVLDFQGQEADSGPNSTVLLANYDRSTSSWKTCKPSLVEECTEFSEHKEEA